MPDHCTNSLDRPSSLILQSAICTQTGIPCPICFSSRSWMDLACGAVYEDACMASSEDAKMIVQALQKRIFRKSECIPDVEKRCRHLCKGQPRKWVSHDAVCYHICGCHQEDEVMQNGSRVVQLFVIPDHHDHVINEVAYKYSGKKIWCPCHSKY